MFGRRVINPRRFDIPIGQFFETPALVGARPALLIAACANHITHIIVCIG
jgi:hypothetical protein